MTRVDRVGPITLREVARVAGVSVSTASKALNDRFDVKADTREHVLRVAEELEFSPNALARGLTAGRSHTVGILTNDLTARFVPQIMWGAEIALGHERSTVLLSNSDRDAHRQEGHLQALLERRVDGLLIVDEQLELREPIRPIPNLTVVYVLGFSTNPKDTSLVPDVHAGGRLAADHLLSLGRRSIAHLGGPLWSHSGRERAAGFRDAIRDAADASADALVLHGEWSEQWGWDGTAQLLEIRPDIDALFAANDQIARGAVDYLQARGYRIPDDVAVVGYDNWEVLSRYGRTPITTIDMGLDRLGAEAVRQLYDADHRRQGQVLIVPELRVRYSTLGTAAPPETDTQRPQPNGYPTLNSSG